MNTIRTTTQIVAVLAVLALGIQAAAQESEALPSRLADVEQAVDLIRKRYVYDSGLDWTRLRKKYLLEAASLGSNFKRFELLERLVEELHDHHAHLNQNSTSSYRLVPSGLHVWASYQHTNYIVDEVRAGSAAERSGLRGGDIILELDEIPVAKAVRKRLKPFQIQDTDEARSWAVRTLLAGKHEQKRFESGSNVMEKA